MDPMVSLYYFAPACAVINGVFTLVVEAPKDDHARHHQPRLWNAHCQRLCRFRPQCLQSCYSSARHPAVVLTLSGVLKDILLVIASMAIFKDPVAPTQWFGYSIALGGLMYYKLGGDKLKTLGTDTRLMVGTFQQERPVLSKALVFVAALAGIAILVLGVWPALMA